MEESPRLSPAGRPPAEASSILRNRPFVLLWAAQAISMTAQQAIWFGMMVVVEEVSQSGAQLTIAVLSTVIPGVLLGLVAGVFVDRVNKKTVLVATNFLRAVAVLGYLLYPWSLQFVYVANFVFVAISQFFGPAEAGTIPALVSRKQLVAANSAFNITFTASQVVGIVLLAPWAIKLLGAPALFVVTAGLYVWAGALVSVLPPGVRPARPLSTLRRATLVGEVGRDLQETWGFIRTDAQTWWSMLRITLTQTLMLVLGTLGPRYAVAVLGIRPEDAVFVLAPAFLGIVGVTALLSRITRRFGIPQLVNLGLLLTGLALLGISLVDVVREAVLPALAGGLASSATLAPRAGLVPPVVALSLLLGVGYALASVPSQAVLMERAPVESRGRVFAVLWLFTNVAAIVPLAFLGGLTDVVGVNAVLGLAAALVLATAAASYRSARPRA